MSHVRTKGITGATGIPISDAGLVLLDYATSGKEGKKNRARLTEREWHTLVNARQALSEEFARVANIRSTLRAKRRAKRGCS